MASLYSVTYNTNNSTGGTTPATQTAESNSETYTFTAPIAETYGLSKTGYGLVGWSENPTATIPEYSPGSTITLDRTNPNKTLYAVWSNWELLPNMQTMVPDVCEMANIGDTRQIIDARDSKTYWIAKLADGNCWMTQNLDYDDPNSTRVTSTGGNNGGPTNGSWDTDNTTARQYWDPGEKIVSSGTLAAANDSTDPHLLVGNYYSWLSATNGTGSSVTADGVDASGSICPKGWQLPSNNSNFGPTFADLQSAYEIDNTGSELTISPLYFQYGGYVDNNSLLYAGSNGYYWSSTSASFPNSYLLAFYGNGVFPSSNLSRYAGFSIRCVAKIKETK